MFAPQLVLSEEDRLKLTLGTEQLSALTAYTFKPEGWPAITVNGPAVTVTVGAEVVLDVVEQTVFIPSTAVFFPSKPVESTHQ